MLVENNIDYEKGLCPFYARIPAWGVIQIVYKFSAYTAGFFIAVVTLGMIIMKKFVGVFVKKIEYKKLLVTAGCKLTHFVG